MAAAQVPSPAEEPITPVPPPPPVDARRVALGAALFADPRLSRDGTRSCASCHDLASNGASALARDHAPDGSPIATNTNTVFNAALSFRLNWAGSARTLEEQAEGALLRPDIMANTRAQAVATLVADPAMARSFRDAYGHVPDWPSLLDAIATFERTLLTPDSRFDRWLKGDATALSPEEKAGYETFRSLGCIACHQGVNIGGNLFERVGVLRAVPGLERKVMRVPSLRNVAVTPPYLDDGSAKTLDDAVRRMAVGQLGLDLTEAEVSRIVAFLGSLTGQYEGRPLRAPQ
ncbi:c-type cytochrome [Rhodovastum atsumiense]|uniref:C-type cytochrome n=2 Tax=Rhodovastum atsumiense TaxID=504468 RepID=A0A5M6IYA1_9PROT|nr:c-type cytochrome [Rhodovastum atsumiense]